MTTSHKPGRCPAVRRTIVATLGFALLIALAAQVSIPLYPVPMTLQTAAVLLAGGVLGARWGTAAVVLYLALAVAGLPVLADGAGGFRAASGGTAGYLIAFPAAAFVTGWAAERGWLTRVLPGMTVLVGAHLLTLALGVTWLILSVGLDPLRAVDVGATPFLIGAVLKSGLVLAALWAWRRFRPGR